MGRRIFSILILAVYALLPLLCLGGVFAHACPQDVDACGHEEYCSYDPCAQTPLGSVRVDVAGGHALHVLVPAEAPPPAFVAPAAPLSPTVAAPTRERIHPATTAVLLI